MGLLVRHGQEAADTSSDGVLGQLWVGELPKLLQGCLLVRDAQATGLKQVGGDIVPQDLEGSLDAGTRGDGGAGRTAQVGVVEVGQAGLRLLTSVNHKPRGEVPFKPSRVILQDFPGVPVVVDLART